MKCTVLFKGVAAVTIIHVNIRHDQELYLNTSVCKPVFMDDLSIQALLM